MKHKILTPDYARELYATEAMHDIQKAYNISFNELFYMLYHGKVMPNNEGT